MPSVACVCGCLKWLRDYLVNKGMKSISLANIGDGLDNLSFQVLTKRWGAGKPAKRRESPLKRGESHRSMRAPHHNKLHQRRFERSSDEGIDVIGINITVDAAQRSTNPAGPPTWPSDIDKPSTSSGRSTPRVTTPPRYNKFGAIGRKIPRKMDYITVRAIHTIDQHAQQVQRRVQAVAYALSNPPVAEN
ncbi:hypothetical protein QAD02_023732 [Eretmocerus hayati]|uniref:Uncharacterized protein n=1 Tax=Eretmocerus hayati TaxID=131215 RepID=A0ACC2PWU1_9HYME|nr:hypothetical protein QAD02_023732 [Eretmocerus hayati]